MAKPKKHGKPVSPESKERLWMAAIETIGGIIRALIQYGAITLICYFGYLSIQSLSGKETLAKVVIAWATDLKMNQWLAWLIAGGSAVYGYRARRLGKRRIQELSDEKARLEQLIDPKRESSRLLKSGDTRPEDE